MAIKLRVGLLKPGKRFQREREFWVAMVAAAAAADKEPSVQISGLFPDPAITLSPTSLAH